MLGHHNQLFQFPLPFFLIFCFIFQVGVKTKGQSEQLSWNETRMNNIGSSNFWEGEEILNDFFWNPIDLINSPNLFAF
jgi:hypothetical protein